MALRDFMVHFRLSDEGEIQFEGFGEATEDALFQLAYPMLDKALTDSLSDQAGNPTPEGIATIREAVDRERKRVRVRKVKQPETDLGRGIKKMMSAPTRMIDRTIREVGARKLKHFPTKGKPN